MKILLVEDEDRSARQALELIARITPAAIVQIAVSRDDAFASMQSAGFDLILCDLRIPPFAKSADVDERHGLAVHAEARKACPGTPIIFLTAFATKRNTREQQSSGGTEDIFGITQYPMVQVIEKDDLDELELLLLQIQTALDSLDDSCELHPGDSSDEMFLRAVRTYAKQINMPKAEVHSMPGGLSGAPLGRITFSSPTSGSANIFMKVVPHDGAVEETRRFNEFVPTRLQLGHFAHSLPPILAGLRSKAA
jgi:CheY-like chemotaxis protein